jgi:hypothetical protein
MADNKTKRLKMSIEQKRTKNSARMKEKYRSSQQYRDYQKSLKLQRAYGITLEQYNEWNKCNDGLCHICNKPEVAFDKKANRLRMLAVDHDKVTGLVRGLLCSVCNRGIGMLRHNAAILNSAIAYINYFNNVTVPGVQNASD